MPIQCRLIDLEDEKKNNPDFKLSPGDMFYQKYTNRKELHLIVILPNGANFDLTHAGDKSHEINWDVTGEPPNITVVPSIAMDATGLHEAWHGWLENGMLRDA